MMLLIFSLVSLVWGSELLPVEVIGWQELGPGPSCQLLEHREQEREKKMREWIHLNQLTADDPLYETIARNYYLTYRFFLDGAVWDEELIEVDIRATLTATIKERLATEAIDNQFFALRGTGIEWMGRLNNFPDTVRWELRGEELFLRYRIFRSQWCFLPEVTSGLWWLDEDVTDFQSVSDPWELIQEEESTEMEDLRIRPSI